MRINARQRWRCQWLTVTVATATAATTTLSVEHKGYSLCITCLGKHIIWIKAITTALHIIIIIIIVVVESESSPVSSPLFLHSFSSRHCCCCCCWLCSFLCVFLFIPSMWDVCVCALSYTLHAYLSHYTVILYCAILYCCQSLLLCTTSPKVKWNEPAPTHNCTKCGILVYYISRWIGRRRSKTECRKRKMDLLRSVCVCVRLCLCHRSSTNNNVLWVGLVIIDTRV